MDLNEVKTILSDIEYKDWRFDAETVGDLLIVLRVSFQDGEEKWSSRKWIISPHAVVSEVIQTAFLAVRVAEEHEMREKFFVSQRAIFGPHIHWQAHWYTSGVLHERPDNRVKKIGDVEEEGGKDLQNEGEWKDGGFPVGIRRESRGAYSAWPRGEQGSEDGGGLSQVGDATDGGEEGIFW